MGTLFYEYAYGKIMTLGYEDFETKEEAVRYFTEFYDLFADVMGDFDDDYMTLRNELIYGKAPYKKVKGQRVAYTSKGTELSFIKLFGFVDGTLFELASTWY